MHPSWGKSEVFEKLPPFVFGERHTFATMLSTSGVSPRVAQEAMRHSTMELTMKVYTDPKLLDIAGAIASLPAMSGKSAGERLPAKATGTHGANSTIPPLTSPLTLPSANMCNNLLQTATLEGVFKTPK